MPFKCMIIIVLTIAQAICLARPLLATVLLLRVLEASRLGTVRNAAMTLDFISSPGPKCPANGDQNGFVAGLSSAMQALESVMAEIAPTNIPILLVGESGTGK